MRWNLVDALYVAKGSPHLLDDVHLFERRLQCLCGRLHSVDGRVTGSFGCGAGVFTRGPRHFSRLPEALPLLPDGFKGLTMLVADLTGLLC